MIVALVAVGLAAAAQPAAKPVTFSADVAPIIQSRCVTCHRTDGDAPFSLASLDEVRRRASMVVAVTKSRYMPPWKPAPGAGDFHGSRRMPDEEIAIIEKYLPKQMTDQEIHDTILALVKDTGASAMKDMGRVMAALKERYAGKLDFGKASGAVKKILSGN